MSRWTFYVDIHANQLLSMSPVMAPSPTTASSKSSVEAGWE